MGSVALAAVHKSGGLFNDAPAVGELSGVFSWLSPKAVCHYHLLGTDITEAQGRPGVEV